MTLVSLSKTLNYNCFSPPRGKWVPVRAEMVIVLDLVAQVNYAHAVYSPGSWDGLRNESGVIMLEAL